MADRINYIADAIDQMWVVLKADEGLSDKVGNLFYTRQLPDPAVMVEPGPYFCGWPTEDDGQWWAGAATKSRITMQFMALAISGDWFDYRTLLGIMVDAQSALIADFRNMATSRLQLNGYVAGMTPGGVSWSWWPAFRSDNGASVARWRLQLDLRNPNL